MSSSLIVWFITRLSISLSLCVVLVFNWLLCPTITHLMCLEGMVWTQEKWNLVVLIVLLLLPIWYWVWYSDWQCSELILGECNPLSVVWIFCGFHGFLLGFMLSVDKVLDLCAGFTLFGELYCDTGLLCWWNATVFLRWDLFFGYCLQWRFLGNGLLSDLECVILFGLFVGAVRKSTSESGGGQTASFQFSTSLSRIHCWFSVYQS